MQRIGVERGCCSQWENEVKETSQKVEERELICVEKEKNLEDKEKRIDAKQGQWMETEKKMQQNAEQLPSVIQMNVSGKQFVAPKDIFLKHKGSLFEQIITSNHSQQLPTGEIFIGRDPKYFRYVFTFLLNERLPAISNKKKLPDIANEFQHFRIPFELNLIPSVLDNMLGEEMFSPVIRSWFPTKKVQLLYEASRLFLHIPWFFSSLPSSLSSYPQSLIYLYLLINKARDGFESSEFHKLCDNKGPTLTVIRSSEGYIFGGFTRLHWDSTKTWKYDTESFIFTLTNPHNIPPTKYPLDQQKNRSAIFCFPSHGPSFGGGFDICIFNNSWKTPNNYTNFPFSYIDTTGKGNKTFTGKSTFTVNEIKVFSLFK